MRSSFIALIVATGCAVAQEVVRLDGSVVTEERLRARIALLMSEAKVSGLAVTVFNRNRPAFSGAFGTADAARKTPLTMSSVMTAASFSKMVFSAVVLQLANERVLHLDTPLVRYLDRPLSDHRFTDPQRGYSDLRGDDRTDKVTARMCLTHTSGLPNWRWYEADGRLRFLFDPGARYRYSGEGIRLLQFVIETITGKNVETIARERVFAPLELNSTGFVWRGELSGRMCRGHDANGRPYPGGMRTVPDAAGSLVSTPDDMTKFIAAIMDDDGPFRTIVDTMTRRQVRIRSLRQFGPLSMTDSTLNDHIQLGYGLGVGLLQSPFGRAFFKEANDDGWQHYCIVYPERQIAILIMTNSDNGDSIFKSLLEFAIADTFTPWQWENYVPYNER